MTRMIDVRSNSTLAELCRRALVFADAQLSRPSQAVDLALAELERAALRYVAAKVRATGEQITSDVGARFLAEFINGLE